MSLSGNLTQWGLTPAFGRCNAKSTLRLSKAGLWFGLVVFLSIASASFGQETRASLGGKVFDPAGKVIPAATVTVISENTGGKQTTTSNVEGNWQPQFLLPGRYLIYVKVAGFKKYL